MSPKVIDKSIEYVALFIHSFVNRLHVLSKNFEKKRKKQEFLIFFNKWAIGSDTTDY